MDRHIVWIEKIVPANFSEIILLWLLRIISKILNACSCLCQVTKFYSLISKQVEVMTCYVRLTTQLIFTFHFVCVALQSNQWMTIKFVNLPQPRTNLNLPISEVWCLKPWSHLADLESRPPTTWELPTTADLILVWRGRDRSRPSNDHSRFLSASSDGRQSL